MVQRQRSGLAALTNSWFAAGISAQRLMTPRYGLSEAEGHARPKAEPARLAPTASTDRIISLPFWADFSTMAEIRFDLH